MRVKKVDPGVFRFEPESNDVPAWDLSKKELIEQGWSSSLVELLSPHLRNERMRKIELIASDAAALAKLY